MSALLIAKQLLKKSTRLYAGALCYLSFVFLVVFTPLAISSEPIMDVDSFVHESFGGQVASPETLWLTKALKNQAAEIVHHPFSGLRLRYWRQNSKTAWVLEEVGKELPITMGISVSENAIVSMQVLHYRESRGGEIRHGFFTRQFLGASLNVDKKLSQPIDGISGATLSVRATKKMARLALLFHQAVIGSDEDALSEMQP